MNWKTNRDEKHKHFNEEKLGLGGKENTSSLMKIAQGDDSNVFKLSKNLWLKNLQFVILKYSRFCLFIPFAFISVLLYTQIFLILTVCSCHATYLFQSESTLYSCLNVKELLLKAGAKSKFKWLQLDSNPQPLSS